jgi:hypothetical protein
MNKKLIFIIIIFVAILAIIFVIRKNKKQNRVCFKDNCFDVELAITDEEQMRGLMFRNYLDPKRGMLFVFGGESESSFWMKNTLIPLDIIWINENKEVVFISENTQPCKEDFCPTINPNQKAKYVLEINAGISKEIGLKVGDELEISLSEK